MLLLLLLACDPKPSVSDDTDPIDTPAWQPPDCDVAPSAHGLRRATTTRYRRIVTDLLGEPGAWGAALPAESGGFEGWPDAQPTGAGLVDAWSTAASEVADAILARGSITTRYEAEALAITVGSPIELTADPSATWWDAPLNQGAVRVPIHVEASVAGDWRMSVRALWTEGYDRTEQRPMMHWELGDWRGPFGTVDGFFDTPSILTWEVPLEAGSHDLTLVLDPIQLLFSAVAIDWIEVTVPSRHAASFDSPLRARLVPCQPETAGAEACATQVLTPLVRRAWRTGPGEVEGLVSLVTATIADGGTFDEGLHDALRALLTSPRFLFRVEDNADLSPGAQRPASPIEVAERTAALLWASIPDEPLLACALDGTLGPDPGPCNLADQIDRMLRDPRADALSYDFARQWLGLDLLNGLEPTVTPLDDTTRAAMAAETYAMLEASRTDGADVLDLVDADWTVVDPTMAAFYGLPASGRVPVAPGRAGLLGQASVLAMTSLPDRTSPVLRGKWILDRLKCDPPPAPPDGIPVLSASATDGDVASILAAHRADPLCASCHDRIDPLGIPLEGFDALGHARDAYRDGTPVSTASELASGAPVDGLLDLASALREDPTVRRCIVERFAAWAIERPITSDDTCLIDTLAGDPSTPISLHDLARAIANQPALSTVVAP